MAEKYDYRAVLENDINEWIDENIQYVKERTEDANDISEVEEFLYDTLWVEDSVTGNGSGSYTFNTALAKGYVMENFDLAKEAYEEFGCIEKFMEALVADHWEDIDVTIRCYLLGEIINKIIDERGADL